MEPILKGTHAFAGTVDTLARYIYDHWGLVIDERHRSMLQTRLQRRMRELGRRSLEAYCDYLFKEGAIAREHDVICQAVTTQTTSFMREAHHFEYITQVYLPELSAKGRHQQSLRAWSAAASIGQEAYTLAVTLAEYQRRHSRLSNFEILATDISTEALNQVRNAIYPRKDIAILAPELRERYFLRGRKQLSNYVRVAPELRRRVTPRQLNLVDTPYSVAAGFDIIMIRNCLIYFDSQTRLKVVHALRDRLRPGGLLITGHSEHFPAKSLEMQAVGPTLYRRTTRGAS